MGITLTFQDFKDVLKMPRPIAVGFFAQFSIMPFLGWGVVLAKKHFPAEPLTAVPCAISSVFHSVIGSILAGVWRWRG
jgi:predicted Na+-dependent transporter